MKFTAHCVQVCDCTEHPTLRARFRLKDGILPTVFEAVEVECPNCGHVWSWFKTSPTQQVPALG